MQAARIWVLAHLASLFFLSYITIWMKLHNNLQP